MARMMLMRTGRLGMLNIFPQIAAGQGTPLRKPKNYMVISGKPIVIGVCSEVDDEVPKYTWGVDRFDLRVY